MTVTRTCDGWDVRTDTGDVLHWQSADRPTDAEIAAAVASLAEAHAAEAVARESDHADE